ncbi:hypothetical protein [Thalassospira lucentensis]|uniref:hypothetical protein n=1 Tax=Thalassospira lucentensis TaxID=168935 RepID=UPI00142DDF3B|nr:hypothetical protein [Thalassospira lucentensis]NIZ00164.1 hypothetical protein [Thalassospira lucentensis]
MSRKIINVHVAVDFGAREYYNYLVDNFTHTAKDSERLFFFCYALDSEAFNHFRKDARLSGCFEVYKMPGAYRLRTLNDWRIFLRAKITQNASLGGSNGHAAGLNRIMRTLPNLAGHNIIADSDVAVIQKGWDEIIEEELTDVDVIGTPYEPIGGFSSGTSKIQTYKDFPNPIWLAIKDGCDISGMNWMPLKEKNIAIKSQDDSDLYNLPIGYEVVRDVGWRFPQFCKEHNIKAKAFRQIKPSSAEIQVLRTGKDYNEEYQLDGKAFVGHQRGGSRHAFRATDISKSFYECVEKEVGSRKNDV